MFAVYERPIIHPDELPVSRLDVALGHHSFWSAWAGLGTWEEERYTQAQKVLYKLLGGFLPAPEAPISNQAMEVYDRLCQRYLAPVIYRGDFPSNLEDDDEENDFDPWDSFESNILWEIRQEQELINAGRFPTEF